MVINMENNEEQNIIQKAQEAQQKIQEAKQAAQEAKQAAEEISKLAANIASGNYLAAAKNALNLLKNKTFRKKLKQTLIMSLIGALVPIIIAVCFFGILNTVKDALIGLLSDVGTSISTFFADTWKWLTDDKWIKLDEPIEGSEDYTIVDKYIDELESMGISLKELRLLGDADYSDEEALLEDENNKAMVQKYIAEFIRADIITQKPHKRSGTDLVKSDNQNWIDGGVYLYRTKEEPTVDEDDFENSNTIKMENVEVEDKDYKQMEFIQNDEFMEKLGRTGQSISSLFEQSVVTNDKTIVDELRYKYTIDNSTGKLIFVEIKTQTSSTWYSDLPNPTVSEATYELKFVPIEYKKYISKYSMPYEFLINLCLITQNPEFAYHVALLARETNIELIVQDSTTIEKEIVEGEEDRDFYRNLDNNKTSEALLYSSTTVEVKKETITTTQTPVLVIKQADTWSFEEKFNYTKNIEQTLTEKETVVEQNDEIPETLSNYYEGRPSYWYETITTESRTTTKVITSKTTYNEEILENSVEKSKQFLGLLRNSTGTCTHENCFEEGKNPTLSQPIALQCAQDAVYNKKGTNVQYRIPNRTITEAPLNKLTSGIEMLYTILQPEVSDDEEEQKYVSEYVTRMSGIVEHLRYLMTFPENEISIIDDDDYILSDEYIGQDFGLVWPLSKQGYVTSPFGNRYHPVDKVYKQHNGVDIGVVTGTEVYSVADGTVTNLITNKDLASGLAVYIQHTNGMRSIYMHLSEIKVSVGQVVSKGQLIALSGNTGKSTGPHLHFGLVFNGQYVNPLQYVKYGT